jgi:tetratricopeptide (TPR) repeat protein
MKSNLIETRQIRIFISSTFRDMMAERDHLVTKVFPALRRYCEERGITLFELDLRWGISEEESKQGKVVDICLKEIRNTTPFFIGLLGDRYGWVPSPQERGIISANTPVFEDHPWIEDELANGTSITEIEIQEGVLRSPEKVNAYFYFRSPKMEVAEDFKEKPGSREAEKLAALKQKIRGQRDYPVEEYDSVERLGTLVEQDFKALADRLFPQGALSPLEKERLEQRIFLKSKTGVYVPNPEWFERLDTFVASDERAIVITGGSGMGKSALLANWIAQRGERPEEKILYHFIGNSRAEGDYRKITRRLIDEARDIYRLPPESSGGEFSGGAQPGEGADKPDKQQEILQNLLFALPKQERLIVILDGMDRLFDIDNAKLLNWLPAFPPNVKFICSTLPNDPACDVLTRRQYNTFPVEALPLESRKRIVRDYLKSFGKGLTPARVERIAADPENENPLVLRALLDELRVFGVHEKIDREIDRYLAAPDMDSFFALVLERMEKTYADGDCNLVKDVFSLIAVSRGGLSEPEILELTGVKPLFWSQLFNATAGHLATRNGLVGFSHRFIRDAAWKQYLSDGNETAYRRRIADAMETSASRERKYDELPHQLFALKDWDKLYAFLTDFDVFEYINRKDQYEIRKYWRALQKSDEEKYSLHKYLDLETGGISQEELACLYHAIGLIANEIDAPVDIVWEYLRQALDIMTTIRGLNHPDTAAIYDDIGFMFHRYLWTYDNAYDLTFKYLERALEIRETVLGKNHPDTARSYSILGAVYNICHDYPKAMEYQKQALEIREAVLGKNHPDTARSYHYIGDVYDSLKEYDKAIGYFKQELEIIKAFFGKNHPRTVDVYIHIGEWYLHKAKDYPKALEYYRQALESKETFFGKNHPDTADSYHDIGEVYGIYLQDYAQALEYYKQALEIRKTVLGKNHFDTASSYIHIGGMYADRLGDHAKAAEYFQQSLKIEETILGKNHSKTAQSYYNLGRTWYRAGDYAKALECHRQALAIYEALGKPEADEVRESIKKLEEK